MIGLTLKQAEQKLKEQGITKIEIINNFEYEISGSELLVTSCKIVGKTAQVTLGSFKIDI